MVMVLVDRESSDLAAKLFRGLGDPTRLSILLALSSGERRVTDLVAELGCSQANTSSHLACLRDCGLVDWRTEGRQNFYRIANPELNGLLASTERLLAFVGRDIELCPLSGDNGQPDTAKEGPSYR